jgi:mono/diheme cytochrome c family protein
MITLLFTVLLITGCAADTAVPDPDQTAGSQSASAAASEPASGATAPDVGPMRMGPGSGMMARHHAQVPDEYAGLLNPVAADEESLERGAAIYEQYCTSCHGDGGMGDGPAGQQLDPAPAAIAHTSRMLGDDYLFWRISEGGAHEPFSSAMPRWQNVLDDDDRWDVINYVRALGSGQVMPGRGPQSGATFDPQAEAERHEQIAADGVAQDVLSQEEADTFLAVHADLDSLMAEEQTDTSGGMDDMQEQMLALLVEQGTISQEEADMFSAAHEKLLAAGLME